MLKNNIDQQGKVMLVAGGGGGIGGVTCQEFAQAGAKVAVVDVSAEAGNATVTKIQEMGGEARFFQAGVRQAMDVQSYVASTIEAFGRCAAFFNNAGVEGRLSPLAEFSEEVWEHVISINL